MKLNKIKIFAVIGLLAFSAGACKKSFFTNTNRNPNAVDFVNPNLLLPTCEISLAFTQGGDLSRYSSLFSQQAYGAQNQTEAFFTYGINAGTFENGWADMYTSTMENIYALKTSCDSLGFYNAYGGVARILMAYSMQLMVDYWGDVPYTEAFRGKIDPSHLQPKYDNAAALYDTIAKLVDDGIALFGNTANDLRGPADDDDVLYKGDLDLWTKFGHAIKARLYIHQSKGDATMAQKALDEIANSFTSNEENATYFFAGGGTTRNPWTQFMSDRKGYVDFRNSTYMVSQMIANSDPRLPKIIDTSKHVLAAYYGSDGSPVEFINNDEMKFDSAEAVIKSGGSTAAAQGAFQRAIEANMIKLGVSSGNINTYLTANGTLPANADDALAKIAAEEYRSQFLNPEAFTTYRRTGVPALSAPSGASGNVPRRMIYPQSEYSYNAKNVPQSTLYTPKIFWDK
jgi:hypothetical protein